MERITTPCPACGSSSLIVGSGGYLTCGSLECKDPTAADETLRGLVRLRRRRDGLVAESARLAETLDAVAAARTP